MLGFWFGSYGERTVSGKRVYESITPDQRRACLLAEIGFSQEHIVRMPQDREMEPSAKG